MSTKLVIVESPAKAKTINKYLGKDYEVLASFGHIRDLPAKDGSVDPENDFAMLWETEGRGAKQVAEIARAAKNAEKVILATDPNLEGEATATYLLRMLRDSSGAAERLTHVLSGSRYIGELMEWIPESVAWLDSSDLLRPRSGAALDDEALAAAANRSRELGDLKYWHLFV